MLVGGFSAATASRNPTGQERAAIVAVIKHDSPDLKLLIKRVKISTVDSSYAEADTYILPVGDANAPAQFFLRRSGGGWHIIHHYGLGAERCNVEPRRVLRDLGFVICVDPLTNKFVPTTPP